MAPVVVHVAAGVLVGEEPLRSLELGHRFPVRGTSPTASATPRTSTPRSSMKSAPVSMITLTRLSRWRSVQRWLCTMDVSHKARPSQTNHKGVTCGDPSPPTLATRQVRSDPKNASRSSALIATRRPLRCPAVPN